MWTEIIGKLFILWCPMYWTAVNSQPQNHIKARIGQNVSIPCPLDIPVLIYIGWYQCTIEDDCRSHWDEHRVAHVDNKTLVYVDYPKKYELETNGTLTIFDIVPEDDEKLFICKGKIQFSATVENITILEIITEPPEITTRYPLEYEVIEGMPLTLQFKVHGYPYPLVTLRHNQDIVMSEAKMDPIYVRYNASNLYNGDYTCTAESPLGNASFAIKVKVIARAGTNSTSSQGNGTSDNLNREGSCNGTDWQTWFWVLLSVVVLGLLVAVVLGLLAKWGRIKLCHHGTFQTGVGSFELSTAHNNKGHYARSEDAMDEGSQVESEGTNGLGWDDEVMPPEL